MGVVFIFGFVMEKLFGVISLKMIIGWYWIGFNLYYLKNLKWDKNDG